MDWKICSLFVDGGGALLVWQGEGGDAGWAWSGKEGWALLVWQGEGGEAGWAWLSEAVGGVP